MRYVLTVAWFVGGGMGVYPGAELWRDAQRMGERLRQQARGSRRSVAVWGIHAPCDKTVARFVGGGMPMDRHHRRKESGSLQSAPVGYIRAHCGKTAAPFAGARVVVGVRPQEPRYRVCRKERDLLPSVAASGMPAGSDLKARSFVGVLVVADGQYC